MFGITITNWREATRTRLQFGCRSAADAVKAKLEAMGLREMNVDISEVEEISTAGYDRGQAEKDRAAILISALMT